MIMMMEEEGRCETGAFIMMGAAGSCPRHCVSTHGYWKELSSGSSFELLLAKCSTRVAPSTRV